ncbi:MAG: hypothetical protein Q9186_003046 [Xanthomendoza sp. 1 TL-2023]
MAAASRGLGPQSSLSTPPPDSPAPSKDKSSELNILSTYTSLLTSNHTLTAPLAAILSLITILSHSPPSTSSETLSLLSHHSTILKTSLSNPIPATAGTDLFQRYVVGTLQSPTSSTSSSSSSTEDGFKGIRDQLLENGRAFVERATEARGVIAQTAKKLVREGSTVMTSGGSRVVGAVLNAAAEEGVRFRVIYVRAASSSSSAAQGREQEKEKGKDGMLAQLREKGVRVAVIPPEAVAYSVGETTMVMVGAEGVVENGGVVSRLGTYQMTMLAKGKGKPVYVVAESHKFVRLYPLGQYDLPVRQTVLDFRDQDDDDHEGGSESSGVYEEVVDFTPPELITALVTEAGVHTPSAVSEELIKIWY